MIESLKLKNFKCFEEIELKFKNLTLFTGINSGENQCNSKYFIFKTKF